MSFPTIQRYRRHFRNFWASIDEYLDMPHDLRRGLIEICADVADEAGRLPLGRRLLIQAMGGADGADGVIAFCKSCPFVHCYEHDGKPYAVVPALAVLNESSRLKKGQSSELPQPPANEHSDPALRKAIEIVGFNAPWWTAGGGCSVGREGVSDPKPKSSVGLQRQAVRAPKHVHHTPDPASVEPKVELSQVARCDAVAIGRDGVDELPVRVTVEKPSGPSLARNLTSPNRTGEEPNPNPPIDGPSSRARALHPAVETAIARWRETACRHAPEASVRDGDLLSLANEFGTDAFVSGVDRHCGAGAQYFGRTDPLRSLRLRCEWARSRPPRGETRVESRANAGARPDGRTHRTVQVDVRKLRAYAEGTAADDVVAEVEAALMVVHEPEQPPVIRPFRDWSDVERNAALANILTGGAETQHA